MILDLLICFYFIILFVYFLQGDACTSCPSAGAVVGDGVAVPGPKGEKGDPGPPGEGKSGKNVKALVYKWIYFKFCAVRIAHDELGFFGGFFCHFRESQVCLVCRAPSVPKESRCEFPFIILSCL